MDKSYFIVRKEIVDLVPKHCKSVLDVGCGPGITGAAIKDKTKGAVYGLEIDEEAVEIAKGNMDKVFQEDVTSFFSRVPKSSYDCIIFADILEHLLDPWLVLKQSKMFLKPNGIIIISLPNIRFHSTFYHLFFKAEWPYHESGIHDKTHLRFFTRKNMLQLVKSADLQLQTIQPYYLIVNKKTVLNKFRRFVGIPGIRSFFTFQYLMVLSQKEE